MQTSMETAKQRLAESDMPVESEHNNHAEICLLSSTSSSSLVWSGLLVPKQNMQTSMKTVKQGPSRSTRRKKSKRQMRQIEKKNGRLAQSNMPMQSEHNNSGPVAAKNHAEEGHPELNFVGPEQNNEGPSRSAQWKKFKRQKLQVLKKELLAQNNMPMESEHNNSGPTANKNHAEEGRSQLNFVNNEGPSRSARRKKFKRQLRQIEKKNGRLAQSKMPVESNHSNSGPAATKNHAEEAYLSLWLKMSLEEGQSIDDDEDKPFDIFAGEIDVFSDEDFDMEK